jgi:GST-like protein
MPAIVDRVPADGGEPVTAIKSGAILVDLAEKTGQFLPPAGMENRAELLAG